MNLLWILLYAAIVTVATATPVSVSSVFQSEEEKLCTQGPVQWCQNLTTAKSCGAVRHCIQTVWLYQNLPDDNGDVCQICKDMVAQARAQLQSNETQEELKEVFEGSCKLIPVKAVAQECMKLADEFIPELVETLASQMNPQVVCAVAGLCNNAKVDALLAQGKDDPTEIFTGGNLGEKKNCEGCYLITAQMKKKFINTPRDDILDNVLEMCGRLDSFSDSCAAVAVTYFDNVYNQLRDQIVPESVCHLAGMCSYMFHSHRQSKVEMTLGSSVGFVEETQNDLACDFCEQLIVHLKDILVANTTESEFQQVLLGLCKQTGNFADECKTMVDEYYQLIYNFLTSSLKPKEICSAVGLCPRPGPSQKGPIWPLLPETAADILKSKSQPETVPMTPLNPAQKIIGQDETNSYPKLTRVPIGGKGIKVSQAEIQSAQLPIERMFPSSLLVGNPTYCTICEYFLHYLQQALSASATEEEIKTVVKNACSHLPSAVSGQCKEFVDAYGDAVVALLVQEIDPTQVCPSLGLCPPHKTVLDLTSTVNDKPTCPLCLLAVEELADKLKDNKTEKEIECALKSLCNDLPNYLVGECNEFVATYSEQLVDMLVADFSPQEVCVYLKLCDALSSSVTSKEIISNEIPDQSRRPSPTDIIVREQENSDSNLCVICEFVMTQLDNQLKNNATEAEIKILVHDICNYMPRTVASECNKFVDQYADLVITLLAQTMDPKSVCTEIKLCKPTRSMISESIAECTVCDATMGALDQLISNPYITNDVGHLLKKVCQSVPQYKAKCTNLVSIYGQSIINLTARHTESHQICEMIGKCLKERQIVHMFGGKMCTWGPSYWCESEQQAAACGATAHCQEKVWKGEKPRI